MKTTPKTLSKLSSDIEARTLQSQKRLEDLEKTVKLVEQKLEKKLEEANDDFSRQRSQSQSRFDEQINELRNSHVSALESRLAKLEQRLTEQVGLASERSELDKRLSGDLSASIKNLEKKVDEETRSKVEGNIMDRIIALEKRADEHKSLLECNTATKANVATDDQLGY